MCLATRLRNIKSSLVESVKYDNVRTYEINESDASKKSGVKGKRKKN